MEGGEERGREMEGGGERDGGRRGERQGRGRAKERSLYGLTRILAVGLMGPGGWCGATVIGVGRL